MRTEIDNRGQIYGSLLSHGKQYRSMLEVSTKCDRQFIRIISNTGYVSVTNDSTELSPKN